jgi:hypothetical protein
MGDSEGKVSRDLLCREWTYSHEEDTDTERVFRPATFPFPRSRGRISFDLRPDGTVIERGIGPTDRRTETTGRWGLTPDGILEFKHEPNGPAHQRYKVRSVTKDELRLSR